jgi:hypothetical protein
VHDFVFKGEEEPPAPTLMRFKGSIRWRIESLLVHVSKNGEAAAQAVTDFGMVAIWAA